MKPTEGTATRLFPARVRTGDLAVTVGRRIVLKSSFADAPPPEVTEPLPTHGRSCTCGRCVGERVANTMALEEATRGKEVQSWRQRDVYRCGGGSRLVTDAADHLGGICEALRTAQLYVAKLGYAFTIEDIGEDNLSNDRVDEFRARGPACGPDEDPPLRLTPDEREMVREQLAHFGVFPKKNISDKKLIELQDETVDRLMDEKRNPPTT